MAKYCQTCGTSIQDSRKFCSTRCTKLRSDRHTTGDLDFRGNPRVIEKKKRKCKKCSKTYENRNTEQCPECWRKYTRGEDEFGSVTIDTTKMGTTWEGSA